MAGVACLGDVFEAYKCMFARLAEMNGVVKGGHIFFFSSYVETRCLMKTFWFFASVSCWLIFPSVSRLLIPHTWT